MTQIHVESLGLDGKFLAVLRHHNISLVADVVTRVKEGTLGALENIGDNRLKAVIAKLKELSLLDESFVYKKSEVVRKSKKVTKDFQRVSGDDIMPFRWQGQEWQIEIKGWSTLWHHRKTWAMVLIAMYELALEDIRITKDNTHERYMEVAERYNHTDTRSGTTVIRAFPVLEQFHINGEHNPFIMQVGDKSATKNGKVDDSHIRGRGGDSERWRPIMLYPRLPIGAWPKGKCNFTISREVRANNLVLRQVYSGEEITSK